MAEKSATEQSNVPSFLPRTTDIAIIGGGIMGTSLAWQLASRGAGRVTLFERATVAAGASGKTGALLRQHYTNRPEAVLAHASLDVFKHWPDIVGGDPVHVPAPLVVTFASGPSDQENLARLRRNVAMQNAVGIRSRVITPSELHDLQPFARVDDLVAAAYEPDSGYVDAVAACRTMATAAIRAGARVVEGCPVIAIEAEGDHVMGVRTPEGSVAAGTVVCAAGAWSTTLWRISGWPFRFKHCASRSPSFIARSNSTRHTTFTLTPPPASSAGPPVRVGPSSASAAVTSTIPLTLTTTTSGTTRRTRPRHRGDQPPISGDDPCRLPPRLRWAL